MASCTTNQVSQPTPTRVPLTVTIIGAGIAGLSTAIALSRSGHHCTIYEAHAAGSEVGAGIQVSANGVRVLDAWGLIPHFKGLVDRPEELRLRRWEDGKEIGSMPAGKVNEWNYGYGHWCIYRQDLWRVLFEAVRREKVAVNFGRRVVEVSAGEGSVLFEDGKMVNSDLVVCADGIGGKTREAIEAFRGVKVKAYKEHAYRIVLAREDMLKDEETAGLIEKSTQTSWPGEGLFTIWYSLRNGELFNIVASVPRPNPDAPVAEWNHPGDVEEFRGLLAGWCPVVQKVANLVKSISVWTLGEIPPVKGYVSENGRLAVVGDAAHAILPYANQGSAMAMEDAAAMSEFLSTAHNKDQLRHAIQAWSDFRVKRVEKVRRIAQGNANSLTLPDGPAQENRDEQWAASTKVWREDLEKLGEEGWKQSIQAQRPEVDVTAETFGSAEARMFINGYDVISEARKAIKAGIAGQDGGVQRS